MTEQTEAQDYAIGLLVEEMGEVSCMLGKALRFGIDTPGPPAEPYRGASAREWLNVEIGDVMAAIEYACLSGLLDHHALSERKLYKLNKLLSADSRDNLGRRLAPAVAQENKQ